MLMGLHKSGRVDIFEDSEAKKLLNGKYEKYLFPVGTDSTVFVDVYPCDMLKDFKKATISYRITIVRDMLVMDYKDGTSLFMNGECCNNEIDNVVDFIKFLHSFDKLNAYNIQFVNDFSQYGGLVKKPILALSYFRMTVEHDKTKSDFTLKEKHRLLNNDSMGEGVFLIPTLLIALDKFFEIRSDDNNARLFQIDLIGKAIYLNNKITKWSKRKKDFGNDSLRTVSFVNSNSFTFVNSDAYEILNDVKDGRIRVCQYTMMCDEDDLPIDHSLRVADIEGFSPTWFDLYDVLSYKLYTPSDFVEAACTAFYTMKTSNFVLDLMGKSEDMVKTSLEIEFSTSKNGQCGYYTLYDSDLMESHEIDHTFKEFMVSVCEYLHDGPF